MKKQNIIGALFLGLLICLTSCSRQNNGKQLKMCLLVRTTGTPFLRELIGHVEKYAKENNVELTVYDGNDDVAIQTDQLKTQLSQGTKYFIIIPITTECTEQYSRILDSKGGYAVYTNLAPTIESLKISDHFYASMSLELSAGDFQAEILDGYFKNHPEKVPNKQINMLYFDGKFGHKAQINRRSGFLSGMAQRGYSVNILAEDSANWSDTQAREIMFRWLEKYSGTFNAVVSANDAMALGAIDALIKNRYTDNPENTSQDLNKDGTVLKIPVIGVDDTADAKTSMQANKLYATVLQDSEGQANTAFEIMYECAKKGTAIGFTTSKGISGAKQVINETPLTDSSILSQCFIVPFKPITK